MNKKTFFIEQIIKMEIVEEFARQGVNYWDTEINRFTLKHEFLDARES